MFLQGTLSAHIRYVHNEAIYYKCCTSLSTFENFLNNFIDTQFCNNYKIFHLKKS